MRPGSDSYLVQGYNPHTGNNNQSFMQHTADFIYVLDLDSYSASPVVGPQPTMHNSWCSPCAGTGTDDANSATAETLKQAQAGSSAAAAPVATWQAFEGEGVSIAHRQPVTYLTWHAKGDYFASVAPTGCHSPVFQWTMSCQHCWTRLGEEPSLAFALWVCLWRISSSRRTQGIKLPLRLTMRMGQAPESQCLAWQVMLGFGVIRIATHAADGPPKQLYQSLVVSLVSSTPADFGLAVLVGQLLHKSQT